MEETGEIMLFGVRVVVDALRKSVSLNDLNQYVKVEDGRRRQVEEAVPSACCGGYLSADEIGVHPPSVCRGERKRGVPWTEEEHKLFLLGLKRVGKGDWRGISRNFVKTRTPTQVASHAQKYFLRRVNVNRRRRRSSLFDITTDSISPSSMEEDQSYDHGNRKNGMNIFSTQSFDPMNGKTHFQEQRIVKKPTITSGLFGSSAPSLDLSLDMSLNLSLSSGRTGSSSSKSPFQGIRRYNNGKNIIRVA